MEIYKVTFLDGGECVLFGADLPRRQLYLINDDGEWDLIDDNGLDSQSTEDLGCGEDADRDNLWCAAKVVVAHWRAVSTESIGQRKIGSLTQIWPIRFPEYD